MNVSVSQSTLNDPTANNGVFAEGMNDLGEIVGYYLDLDDYPHGYLSTNGTMVALDHPAAVQGTFAASINNAGEIVGYYYDADDIAHGFLYREGAFIALDEPAAVFGTFAETINDAGDVAGFYYDADSQPQPFSRAMGVVAEPAEALVEDPAPVPARKPRRNKRRAEAPGLLEIVEAETAPALPAAPPDAERSENPTPTIAPLRGYVDRVNSSMVEGWAQNPGEPNEPVSLEVLVDGVVLERTLANKYRGDLHNAGVGNGRHAFSVTLPDGLTPAQRATVVVRRASDGRLLESGR